MKIILSRKGFDSTSGGCPSPIFEGGRFISLPIPDKSSTLTYDMLNLDGHNLGKLVSDLSGGRCKANFRAHLDPDLRKETIERAPDWRPLFGQISSAQGHLRNHDIGQGDLFLFFGLFRPAEFSVGRWQFISDEKPRHCLWGWLQISDVMAVDSIDKKQLPWATYHPHFHCQPNPSNTLYIAAEQLALNGQITGIAGAGTFDRMSEHHVLTDKAGAAITSWRLPRWIYPEEGKTPLSYHNNPERWRRDEQYCYLNAVARGQEFVLDAADYPEAIEWIESLLSDT